MVDENTNQISAETLENWDKLLRVTETPAQRVFAFLTMKASATKSLTASLNAGKINKEVAIWWLERIGIYSHSLPSNFVDMLSALYAMCEQALASDVTGNEAHRVMLFKLLPYLHQMAFSPPDNYLTSDAKERAEDLSDFSAFVSEFEKETDRGAALVGGALIGNRLEILLRAHFLNENIAEELLSNSVASVLGGFAARIKMCHALGLITEIEYKECEIIRRVRNKFAHRLHGLTFDDAQIADWCGNLKAMTYLKGSARQRFINSVITLCMVLWYRPAHAAPFKAQVRKWPWHLALP